jgi:hypothetical protein
MATVTACTMNAEDPSQNDATGLPWPHSWLGVYVLVIASFVTWVGLLVAFELIFS